MEWILLCTFILRRGVFKSQNKGDHFLFTELLFFVYLRLIFLSDGIDMIKTEEMLYAVGKKAK